MMLNNENVVIAEMTRTAVGKFGGALKDIPAVDMATFIIEKVLEKGNIDKKLIDEVIFGNVENRSDESCLAKWASIKAGLREDIPAYNVQKLCGSGMQALHNIAEGIILGRTEIGIAGGVENMSRYRFVLDGARWGYRMGDNYLYDTITQTLADNPDPLRRPAANTAENLAKLYEISRQEQDQFAFDSQERARKAIAGGKFKDEIVPIEVSAGRGKTKIFDTDEHPRETTMEELAKLRPIIPDGIVTAGSACGINDGVSAMVLMTEKKAVEMNVKPVARIVSMASVGVKPEIFGIAPAPAINLALKRANLQIKDLGLVEINEAFATQTVACMKELKLNHEILNVNGGAVALGHALGNSGIRISITLLSEMQKRKVQYGAAALCIGSGMGVATIFERL